MTDTSQLHTLARVTIDPEYHDDTDEPPEHYTDADLLERLRARQVEHRDAATRARGHLIDEVERAIVAAADLPPFEQFDRLGWWRGHLTDLVRMTLLVQAELEERVLADSPTAR